MGMDYSVGHMLSEGKKRKGWKVSSWDEGGD